MVILRFFMRMKLLRWHTEWRASFKVFSRLQAQRQEGNVTKKLKLVAHRHEFTHMRDGYLQKSHCGFFLLGVSKRGHAPLPRGAPPGPDPAQPKKQSPQLLREQPPLLPPSGQVVGKKTHRGTGGAHPMPLTTPPAKNGHISNTADSTGDLTPWRTGPHRTPSNDTRGLC